MRFVRLLFGPVLVLVVAASIAGCGDESVSREAHPATLTATAWQVVSVNGRSPVPGAAPTAIFAAAELKGTAGCNSYGGRYAYDPATGAIELQELGMTAMACLERAKNDYEALFTQALGQVRTVSIDPEGRLVMSGNGGEIVLAPAAVQG